ncbi:hypothetical protein OIU85_011701 [Salix viminalis]|uniref:Uncharacterized protein n=1 Tax=Salix viminalis TaxID=40686 RepID=A0A9Q0NTC8_SALVM|nr:hypothetical protein OIU85_011701 [Salix viminalis]
MANGIVRAYTGRRDKFPGRGSSRGGSPIVALQSRIYLTQTQVLRRLTAICVFGTEGPRTPHDDNKYRALLWPFCDSKKSEAPNSTLIGNKELQGGELDDNHIKLQTPFRMFGYKNMSMQKQGQNP